MTSSYESLADVGALPKLTGGTRALTGEVRAFVEDFRVDEVPAYEPEGSGEHLYVRFEKVSLDTPEAVQRIARALGVDARNAGYAGLKDRRAITRQWASFAGADAERLSNVEIDQVRVLEVSRHKNKLRTGHLRANRFELLLRGASADAIDDARARLAELEGRGLPNYFGEQRFGHGGKNLDAAHRWLVEGARAPRERFRRKLYVSSLQSALFNALCAERVQEGSMDSVIAGDLLRKEDTGGLFVSEDTAADAERARRFEVSATGAMYGSRMRWPEAEARAREEALLERHGLSMETLEAVRAAGPGTRRPYRVRPTEARLEADPDGVRLFFTLPSGAYATVLLRELLG